MPRLRKHAHLLPILTTLTESPGVYQMKNGQGKVIYVGKAKNLKSRVNSYFLRPQDLNPAKKQMVDQVRNIEITITNTEVEALILETNLIKHLHPKYNILMKDDKNLSYIKITNTPIPELIRTRKKNSDGGQYFGPYVSNVSGIVRYIRRLFRIRACRVQFAREKEKIIVTDRAGKTLPCMDYYIGLCPAPCILRDENIHEHEENIQKARDFLKGKYADVIRTIEEQMKERAKKMDFEGAQELKDILMGVRNIMEYQSVRDKIEGDHDIVVLYEKNSRFFVGITQIRESRVIGNIRFELESRLDMTHEELLSDFLAAHYIESEVDMPDTIALEMIVSDEAIQRYFREKKVVVDAPKQGPRYELLNFTRNQLREYAYKSELATLENKTLTRGHMVHILDRLGYPIPKSGSIRFECYDISHTHGYFTVASRVVIENGKTKNSDYKKYNIKTLQKGEIDDFASLKEVLFRRTLEGLELGNFPNLLIIDGGKGQLSHAIEGIHMGVQKFSELGKGETSGFFTQNAFLLGSLDILPPICSLAKREEEIFLPGDSKSIIFEKGTPELMVLQKARDEAHRFSITANRQTRTKSMKKNLLEELPGFGPATRKKLLKLAGSIDGIRSLSEESLLSVCTKSQVETLRDHGLI